MRDDRQQRADAAHRQIGIGVERKDISRAARLLSADDGGKIAFPFLDIMHQCADGAPLAFKAVEHAVGLILRAVAQEQAETAAVFRIESLDLLLRLRDDARVGLQTRAFRVGQVTENAEIQVRPAVGDAEPFQPLEQLVVPAGQQRSDDGERTVFLADVIHLVARDGTGPHEAVKYDVTDRISAADKRRQQKQRPPRAQRAERAERQQQPNQRQRVDV